MLHFEFQITHINSIFKSALFVKQMDQLNATENTCLHGMALKILNYFDESGHVQTAMRYLSALSINGSYLFFHWIKPSYPIFELSFSLMQRFLDALRFDN